MRQYKGESEDEWLGITCPSDLVEEERYQPEYDADTDPFWGQHEGEL